MKNDFIAKLDEVLTFMNNNRKMECFIEKEILDNCFDGIKSFEFQDAMHQLNDDKYIITHIKNIDETHYRINYRGRFFIENNGYKSQNKTYRHKRAWNIAKTIAVIANALLIIWLTSLSVKKESTDNNVTDKINNLENRIIILEKLK